MSTQIETYELSLAEIREQLPDLPDKILLLKGSVEERIREFREMKRVVDECLVSFIEKNGEVTSGDLRYYTGPEKTEKCRNLRAAIEAVYIAAGGDYDSFVDCLSANALKPGATRKLLGGEYSKHFETITYIDLKEGKAKNVLHEVNTRFLK